MQKGLEQTFLARLPRYKKVSALYFVTRPSGFKSRLCGQETRSDIQILERIIGLIDTDEWFLNVGS